MPTAKQGHQRLRSGLVKDWDSSGETAKLGVVHALNACIHEAEEGDDYECEASLVDIVNSCLKKRTGRKTGRGQFQCTRACSTCSVLRHGSP